MGKFVLLYGKMFLYVFTFFTLLTFSTAINEGYYSSDVGVSSIERLQGCEAIYYHNVSTFNVATHNMSFKINPLDFTQADAFSQIGQFRFTSNLTGFQFPNEGVGWAITMDTDDGASANNPAVKFFANGVANSYTTFASTTSENYTFVIYYDPFSSQYIGEIWDPSSGMVVQQNVSSSFNWNANLFMFYDIVGGRDGGACGVASTDDEYTFISSGARYRWTSDRSVDNIMSGYIDDIIINQTYFYFNINATNNRTGEYISSFNVTLSNSTVDYFFSTTDGNVLTNVTDGIFNVTVESYSYNDNTTFNLNVSSDYTATLGEIIYLESLGDEGLSSLTIGGVVVKDVNGYSSISSLVYSMVDGFGDLSIDSGTGVITLDRALNIGDIGDYQIVVNATDGVYNVGDSFTLTIYDVLVDNCSVANTTFINLNLFDEQDPTTALEGTAQLIFNYTSPNGQYVYVSDIYDASTYFDLCISPSNITVYGSLYLTNTVPAGFTHRFYTINETYNASSPTNYSIFNFNTTTGISDLIITARNVNTYATYSGITASLNRLYVGEGVYRTVQMDRSGDFGKIFFNIEEKTTDYKIIFYDEDGDILKTTDNSKFVCDAGICDLTYLLDPEGVVETTNEVSVGYTYDNTTGIIDFSWSAPSGTTSVVEMSVVKETATGQLSICSITQAGGSGSYQCNASGYTGELFVQGIADGDGKVSEWVSVKDTRFGDFMNLATQGFVGFIIMLTIIGAGSFSPAALAVMTVFGLIVVGWLGIVTAITLTFMIVGTLIGLLIAMKVRS